ncbi:phosphoethanolamine--lipid A transferase [Vibrio plantisponsor]|uniref:Phosphoethanolamine--lipid A transferase n=1 Tax=Vibrio plantisponsor TaxID=664643 RepID=A0ABU4IF20_9VIBR|nr:phosphoethanolamine--lipid A transferase [Vibrio plantisponsor]MDW6017152.1 phosphoethanolamine--lipid A transferase [Vibrio plantisponsor]NNM40094.1 phosphoethanolamine--lipid A transferase [Vibrio plantisponsor]
MKLTKPNISLSYAGITLVLATFFALVMNLPVYSALVGIFGKLDSVKIGFIISLPFFFAAALNFLFNLFSWPYITKPFFITLIIVSSFVSYASYNYGTLFDTEMINNIVETDTSEAGSYLSLYSLVWVALLGFLPATLLAFTKISKPRSWLNFTLRKLGSMMASLVVIGVIAMMYYQDYASVGRNNSYLKKLIIPTQFVYSTTKFVKQKYFSTPIIYKELGLDAKQSPEALAAAESKPTLFVFLLGETARSYNYELNGYDRPTNPYTRDLNVISFKDVSSCGTATAVSVPCMFSAMDKGSFSRDVADNQDNVLDILSHAGVDVAWQENDGGDKQVAKRIKKTEVNRKRVDDMCNGETCYDMAMLENFDQKVAELKGNRMMVMHLIGSHGPTYFQRYPKEMGAFQPDCPRSDIENCSVDQIVNTYDNTIAYTDYVVAQTIDKLKALQDKYNTALVYISDHGESLGENGMFLHGMPYGLAPNNQTHVPLIVWLSDGFKQEKHLKTDCLKKNATSHQYSQDNVFHSLLGIMDVSTNAYNPDMDLFASCRS